MEITFKPTFVRSFKKLEPDLQEEAFEKIELFRNPKNHDKLKVHKLKVRLKNYHSFSVNYKYRIIFTFEALGTADFKEFGSHDIYK